MTNKTPFSEQSYLLHSCSLNFLNNENDAGLISSHLAKIDPWRTLKYAPENLLKYLLRYDSALKRYVIVKEDNICGVIGIRYPWLRGAYIEMLGIFESYQRMGIGSEIIQWAEEQSGIESENLWVIVSEFNQNAIHFYERNGFVKTADIRDLIRPGLNELLYRKNSLTQLGSDWQIRTPAPDLSIRRQHRWQLGLKK